MRPRPSRSPVAILAVGTVVFGGAVAWLARSGARDPRIALAGLLAAVTLTVALLLMVWARRQAGGRPVGKSTNPSRLTVVDLGQGQAAVIFDEPAAHAGAGARPWPHPVNPAQETELAATAIFEAVTAAVGAAEPSLPNDSSPRPSFWHRLRFNRRHRPHPDSNTDFH
jgi:hypothetical protein